MDTIMNWLNGIDGEGNKLQHLKRKARHLHARAADITTEVEKEELQSGKKRKKEVDNWLKDVGQVEFQLQQLEHQLENINITPDFRSKSQASVLTQEIEKLTEQGLFPRGLTLHDYGNSSMTLVTTDMKINDHKLEHCKRKIMSCLTEDDVISRIGVYGPGGVGKTCLLKEIHNELLEHFKNPGGHVYWVSVSHGTSVSILQDKIAEALELCYLFQEKNEIRKAASLSHEMKRRKNLVLILDDVWEHFSAEEVGIPVGENNLKLIFTTRSLDVCRRLNCQETVKVEPLSDAEAWKLFSDGLGSPIPSEAQTVAKLVASECAGLPLGIIVMAGSMRGVVDIEEWRNTLDELINSTEGLTDIETDVFPVLKLSYDRLKDSKLQKCFLLCALYPKYGIIRRDELITLFRSEGLLDGIDGWQKQLDKAHSMLNTLQNVCLLEKVNNVCVKMHNLIRDMAIRITKVMPRFMIASGAELKRIPSGNRWGVDLDKVSLMHNSLSEIQLGATVPMCPSLSTLLLQKNPFTKLPENFFVHMTGLKVLNLSETSIKMLPRSVSELKNLRALLLEFCSRLHFVPSLVKLTKLRELTLSFCWSMKDVPLGVDQLTNLRFMDLEGSKDLCQLLGESFSKLSRIQCLKLDPAVQSISADHLQKLGHLERLEGCRISDISGFNRYVKTQHFRQLCHYEFIVGAGQYKRLDCKQPPHNLNTQENRIVVLCSRSLRCVAVGESELFVPPSNVQSLQVHNCDFHSKSLVAALPSLGSLTALACILIRRCRLIEFIWSPVSVFEVAPLQSVRELTLTDLQEFRGLVTEGVAPAPPQVAFSNLTKMVIKFCPKIKWVFTSSLLKTGLHNLQELEVEGCDEIETIVSKTDCEVSIEAQGQTFLPNLRTLKLRRLPKLISISHEAILGNGLLEELLIENCAELKLLFVLLARHQLRNLKEVRVACCQNLEEIIVSPDCNDQNQNSTVNELPNLKALLLDDLPYLKSMFADEIPVCSSIEQITVRDCPKMRKLPVSIPVSSHGEPLVPLSLKEIKASREWWDSLEWDNLHLNHILQPFTILVPGKSSFKMLQGLPASSERDLRLKDVSDATEANDGDMGSCMLDA
ncbi:disease resistance protein UNI-like [Silene latifolia]|uniref:disease resistance protein UNI-like n=1 Tax=Silene latifolia TaxID=37657 RepID=UPI003D76ECD1